MIVIVDSTPCWASSAPASLLRRCAPGVAQRGNRWPPSNPPTTPRFVRDLADRYGNKLAAIEVWNEPDQANEALFRRPEQGRSATRRCCARPTRRSSRPTRSITVLGGSLVGSNGVFLRALYAAGIKGYYDGLAVHFYTLTLASLRAIREVQLANGDTTPLWLDEFGWTSCWPRQQDPAGTGLRDAGGSQALNITQHLPRAGAARPTWPRRRSTSCRTRGSEDFGVLTDARLAQAGVRARSPKRARLALRAAQPGRR